MNNFIEFFLEGSWPMWLILAVAVFALTVFFERMIVLYGKVNIDKEKFLAHVQRAILAGDLNSAVNYCSESKGPLNSIVKAGIVSVMNKGSNEEVQTAMDVAALKEIPYIEKRTPWLALLGNVATLIGLLSTIVGLIQAFDAVASVDAAQKAVFLAQAIAIAMNGTAFGLMVAIPSLLASALLSAKTQGILDDIHEMSVSTLNLIIQNRDKFKAG